MANEKAEIGIFGGTGIYDSGLLKDSKEITMETPYGKTSDSITIGDFHGTKIAFLPRHGKKHTIPPHMINYRANVWAFKELGVKRIIAPSAVGSLQENFSLVILHYLHNSWILQNLEKPHSLKMEGLFTFLLLTHSVPNYKM